MVITASPVDQNAKVGDTAAFGVEVKGGLLQIIPINGTILRR